MGDRKKCVVMLKQSLLTETSVLQGKRGGQCFDERGRDGIVITHMRSWCAMVERARTA